MLSCNQSVICPPVDIRINERYRVCFRWETGYAYDVEITDYH